jgi:hypothetical protein
MPKLVSTAEEYFFTGALYDHFLTFGSPVTIWKEPMKNIANTGDSVFVGYGDESNAVNYSYTPVSGVYWSILVDKNNQPILNLSEVSAQLQAGGTVRLKVMKDGKEFIMAGKTERIEMDGRSFNLKTTWSMQNYLSLNFYYFDLEGTF